MKPVLISPVYFLRDLIVISFFSPLVFFGKNEYFLLFLCILITSFLGDIYVRAKSPGVYIHDDKINFKNESATVMAWSHLNYWQDEEINIKDIIQIKKSFRIFTIKGLNLWWVIDFVNDRGQTKSLNYDWYKKEDLIVFIKSVHNKNPLIKIDKFVKDLIIT